MKHKYLYGHVNGERVVLRNTVKQIAAFIVKHQYNETIITTLQDQFILNTVIGGFIMNCPDQQFLREKLLPVLAPVQMGIRNAPKFIPIPKIFIEK
jgi:hypothetical protein